jgi:hypothetical protein
MLKNTDPALQIVCPAVITRPSDITSTFNADLYHQYLSSARCGRVLLTCSKLASTQQFLQDNKGAFPTGAALRS